MHKSGASLHIRSQVWLQINLNFWTNWLTRRWLNEGDGRCKFCGDEAEERWHVLVDCPVVVDLWDRLWVGALRPLVGEPVDRVEMGLTKGDSTPRWKLRRRLGFTLRSAIHSLRAADFLNRHDAENRIWRLFLQRLKSDLMEDYHVGKLCGNLADFETRVMVGGVLGRMNGGLVVWSGMMENVECHYWDLFA